MRALLVGGTGPTGPHIIQGLLDRGAEVTIFHRGLHEPADLPPVEHIHGDPHFPETIAEALHGRTFDLAIVTYGRLRHLAEALAGRCDRLISVGGAPAHLGMLCPDRLRPFGMRIGTREQDDLATEPAAPDEATARFAHAAWRSERDVMALHDREAFKATHFRYPRIYGPRQPGPAEWSVVKRVLDGRPWMILPDGGLQIDARCAARNAAECILLGVDHPQQASGQIYNCVEGAQHTWRQWVELIVDMMGGSLQVLSMPARLAAPARALTPLATGVSHSVLDGSKIRQELGYRDAVAPLAALRETVDWLVEHPLTQEQFARDPFDYAAEDRLIAAWMRAVAAVEREAPFSMPAGAHGYDHPKQASPAGGPAG